MIPLVASSLGVRLFEPVMWEIISRLNRELSAGVRKSEKVTLRYPIMPIADGIGSRLIHVDCGPVGIEAPPISDLASG